MVTIRPIAAGEAERCVELGLAAFQGQSKDQILERLLDLRPNGADWQSRKGAQLRAEAQAPEQAGAVCLVAATSTDEVVGFCTVTADAQTGIGHIHNLAVDPSAQSHGTGRALIERAHLWMVEQGMAIAKIDTLQVNEVGRWLYPSTGYSEIVREINYAMPLSPRPVEMLPHNLLSLEGIVQELAPPGAEVSWWAEQVGVGAVCSDNAQEPWAVASAIKVFLMVALFVEKKGDWDSVPPQLPQILDREDGFDAPLAMWDPERPEWEAYQVPSGTLERVIDTLRNYTYRMIVMGMMGSIQQSVIGNPCYNSCANISTLLLGGPEAATAKIHALDPSGGLDSVRVGRYQLTTRTDENENVAPVAAFGRLYKLLAEAQLPGLNTFETAELSSHLMRTTLTPPPAAAAGSPSSSAPAVSCHQKNGGLSIMGKHPAVSSTAGFCRKGGDGTTSGEFVFAINVNLYPSASSSSESGDGTPPAELRALSERLFARFKATLVGTAPPPGAKL